MQYRVSILVALALLSNKLPFQNFMLTIIHRIRTYFQRLESYYHLLVVYSDFNFFLQYMKTYLI